MSLPQPITPALAEAMRAAAPAASPRIRKLRERTMVDTYPLCIERVALTTESFRRTEGEPHIVRRAKALAHTLAHITIFIEDGELIVGEQTGHAAYASVKRTPDAASLSSAGVR